MLPDPQDNVLQLRLLQRRIRDAVIGSRRDSDLHSIERTTSADPLYRLDTLVEPVIEDFCNAWSRSLPMLVLAEGLEPESGRVCPAGLSAEDAEVLILLDPIDGTRRLMYDKRSAWSLAGVAPNKGAGTRLRDIEVAVMTELPTTKMAQGDVLWAVRG